MDLSDMNDSWKLKGIKLLIVPSLVCLRFLWLKNLYDCIDKIAKNVSIFYVNEFWRCWKHFIKMYELFHQMAWLPKPKQICYGLLIQNLLGVVLSWIFNIILCKNQSVGPKQVSSQHIRQNISKWISKENC